MDGAVALARDNPAAARQLLSTLTALTRSETAFHRVRDDLVALGVPADHLPRDAGGAEGKPNLERPTLVCHFLSRHPSRDVE